MSGAVGSAATFAALFDWDGVVVDSSLQHEESWERLAREIGRPLPEGHFKRGFGMKNEAIIPDLLCWASDPAEVARLSLRKESLYREIVEERGLDPLPGVRALLEGLREAGIPRVIGSSTHRINIETGLRVAGLSGLFDGIVSAEDVKAGKPDPEVFLKAAALAGVEPSRCVVLEDALVGIEAALAAGMKTVALATTNPPELLGRAHLVVALPLELSAARLASLFDAAAS